MRRASHPLQGFEVSNLVALLRLTDSWKKEGSQVSKALDIDVREVLPWIIKHIPGVKGHRAHRHSIFPIFPLTGDQEKAKL